MTVTHSPAGHLQPGTQEERGKGHLVKKRKPKWTPGGLHCPDSKDANQG